VSRYMQLTARARKRFQGTLSDYLYIYTSGKSKGIVRLRNEVRSEDDGDLERPAVATRREALKYSCITEIHGQIPDSLESIKSKSIGDGLQQ
jgi:hypothetical protein